MMSPLPVGYSRTEQYVFFPTLETVYMRFRTLLMMITSLSFTLFFFFNQFRCLLLNFKITVASNNVKVVFS